MNISLKTKNIPKLLIVWVVNVAVLSGVVKGVLDVWDVEALRGLARKSRRTLRRDSRTSVW